MKKLWSLALALCCCLAGCGGAEEEKAPSMPRSLAGTYVFETREVEEQYLPTLVMEEDGSFTFTVNLLSGMGKIEGIYSFQDDRVVLAVNNLDFDGFAGDDVKLIYFDVASDKSLMYRGNDQGEGPIGMTEELDLFRLREGAA